jgi:hypothetical protein
VYKVPILWQFIKIYILKPNIGWPFAKVAPVFGTSWGPNPKLVLPPGVRERSGYSLNLLLHHPIKEHFLPLFYLIITLSIGERAMFSGKYMGQMLLGFCTNMPVNCA